MNSVRSGKLVLLLLLVVIGCGVVAVCALSYLQPLSYSNGTRTEGWYVCLDRSTLMYESWRPLPGPAWNHAKVKWQVSFVGPVLLAYPTVAFLFGPFRRWQRRRRWQCTKCGYDLTGNVSGVCPECGTSIHDGPHSEAGATGVMQKQRPSRLVWVSFYLGVAAVSVGLTCLGVCVFYYEFERLWRVGGILTACGGIWLLGLAHCVQHSVPWGSSAQRDRDLES